MRRLAILLLLSPLAIVAPVSADAARSGGACRTLVLGFDADHHLRLDTVVADHVERTLSSKDKLSADVTAWGYYDRKHLDVITDDGVPRKVELISNKQAVRATDVDKFDQGSFAPRLFAENLTFYAYTVSGSTMRRWGVIRSRAGQLKFVPAGVVGHQFHDLTSLQASVFTKVHGVGAEILYGTTRSGALWQIAVPLNGPGRARVVTLAKTGYAGTTELSWSACTSGSGVIHSLVAIDPSANKATWTTIAFPLTKPRAVLRGDVTGQSDWKLSAVL